MHLFVGSQQSLAVVHLSDSGAPVAVRLAVAVATLVAGGARDAVLLARIEHPEAARIAGEDLLRGQVKGRMARVGTGRRAEVDGGDPELLHGRLPKTLRVVVGRPAEPRRLGELIAVEAAAREDDPRVAAGGDGEHGRLVVDRRVVPADLGAS